MNALKSHPRVTFWGLAVLGLAVAFAGAYWLRQAQAAPLKTGEDAVPVQMARVSRQDLPVWISAIGNV